MALVPLRQYLLPRLFDSKHLAELDRASYEEATALSHELAVRVSGKCVEWGKGEGRNSLACHAYFELA